MLQERSAQNNLTFFIDRLKEYNPSGRNQSEEEAKEIDKRMISLLRKYKIDYTTITGNRSGLEEAFGIVRNILDENRRAE